MLALHNMRVGDGVSILVNNHARAKASWRADFYNRWTDTFGVLLWTLGWRVDHGVKKIIALNLQGHRRRRGLDRSHILHVK